MQIALQDSFLRQAANNTVFDASVSFFLCRIKKKKKNLRNAFLWRYFKMLNIALPCDLAFPPLGIYPKELKTVPHKNLPTNVHSGIIQNSARGKAPRVTIDR